VIGKAGDQIYLSLIIPAFNEEARIQKNLGWILNFLKSQSYSSEIIIVDDGSQDRTVEVVRQIAQGNSQLRILRNNENLGKGGAVQVGMREAKGRYLFFFDADLSVPIETLPAFLAELENHCDVAIGTRQKAGARIEVHQPFYRELMGKTYTRLSNWILNLGVSDFTCGFKGFRGDVARDLFSRQRLKNWSFDAEILYLARLKGYRIQEIPVTWRDDRGSKVRLWRDVISSFFGLVQIRLYHLSGRYQ